MRAISARPPWPYAIFYLDKDVENRQWPTPYRGPLLIHASKKWDQKGYKFITDWMDKYVPSKGHHVFGAIVGIAELVDCVSCYKSRWFFGDYGFVLENAVEFKQPIYYLGQVGIFNVPNEFLKRYDFMHQYLKQNLFQAM